MLLRDREEAGKVLAERLKTYRDDPQALILALPRGGVVLGFAMSLALRLPLDVFLVRKLGAPGNPEYALGAVTETGTVRLNRHPDELSARLFLPEGYLEQVIRMEKGEIARRQVLYRGGRALPDLAGRTVLLVDDGLATGATFLASVEALKQVKVGRLVAAIPMGPPETLREVERQVDELAWLLAPEPFYAVGNHYENFAQVEDEEVIACLRQAAQREP